jgi:uncharacterized protein YbjT (DUF2867 family)
MENQYALDGLRVKLAEINAATRAAQHQMRSSAVDKETVTRALAIMGAESGDGAVSLGIAAGTFSRTILETLRGAEEPLCVREIAAALASRAGRPLDKRETGLLVARVRNAMPRLADRLNRELRGRTTYWRVKSYAG